MVSEERRVALSEFLRTRRTRLLPSQVGINEGTRRRTAGLRREEVAQLAGMSVDWYTRLEQGRDIRVSNQVLDSLARALQLNLDERSYLYILAQKQPPPAEAQLSQTFDPALQQILDGIPDFPAYIHGPRLDLLGWNKINALLFDFKPENMRTIRDRNLLWLLFTRQKSSGLVLNWENKAKNVLGLFRANNARYVGEAWFDELIGDLSLVSPEFREWWPTYEVREKQITIKELNHPIVGRLSLQPNNFSLASASNLTMMVYTPLPGTDTATKLKQLSELDKAEAS